jgi:peptidoglycan/LPS O-acetylase OafA/YrhL
LRGEWTGANGHLWRLPIPVTLGANPGNSTLTMTAPTTLAAVVLPLNEGSRSAAYAVVLPIPALLLGGIGLASLNFKKRRRRLWLLSSSVIVLFAVLVGCGGGSTRHTPQNYTVTVTAANASGSLHHSTTVTLTVQ